MNLYLKPTFPAAFVAEHVLPVLEHPSYRPDITSDISTFPHSANLTASASCDALFRASLHEYLLSRSGSIIYADWPGDFAHLMCLMEGPSYEQSWIVDIGMQLLAESDPRPEVPHNALSDAIALMHWHVASGGAA